MPAETRLADGYHVYEITQWRLEIPLQFSTLMQYTKFRLEQTFGSTQLRPFSKAGPRTFNITW